MLNSHGMSCRKHGIAVVLLAALIMVFGSTTAAEESDANDVLVILIGGADNIPDNNGNPPINNSVRKNIELITRLVKESGIVRPDVKNLAVLDGAGLSRATIYEEFEKHQDNSYRTVFCYITGHGNLSEQTQTFLLPSGSRPEITRDTLFGLLRRIAKEQTVLISDASTTYVGAGLNRDNSISLRVAPSVDFVPPSIEGRWKSEYLKLLLLHGHGRVNISSSELARDPQNQGQYSFHYKDNGGLFTHALIQASLKIKIKHKVNDRDVSKYVNWNDYLDLVRNETMSRFEANFKGNTSNMTRQIPTWVPLTSAGDSFSDFEVYKIP